MQTLLSTRLYAWRPLDEDALRHAAGEGFPSLEIFASPRHFDPLDPAQTEVLVERLGSQRVAAKWMHLDLPILTRLGQGDVWDRLTSALIALGVQVVSLPSQPWRTMRRLPELRQLHQRAQQAGARLALDFTAVGQGAVPHPPPDVELCWDLAWPAESDDEDARQVERIAERLPERALGGVRVAHLEGRHRGPPTEREARLLEDIWPHLVPQTMIYDVEDPSQGASAELQRIMREIHSFHSGEKRPLEGDRGGIFWASMAPG